MLQDALVDLTLARRMISGSMGVRTANYFSPSGLSVDDQLGWKIDLEGHFKDWCSRMKAVCGTSRLIAEYVTEGHSCPTISSNLKMSYPKVLRLLKRALNEFADIRGYGEQKKVKIPPTPGQWELIQVITQMRAANEGISPTLEEIAAKRNVSKQAIAEMIKRMGERGLLSYVPARPRSIVLLV